MRLTQALAAVARLWPGPGSLGDAARSRKRIRSSPSPAGVLAALAAAALGGTIAGISGVSLLLARQQRGAQIPGYVWDVEAAGREYRRYYGEDLPGPFRREFQDAAGLVRARRLAEAAGLLETASTQAALPLLFNDLGVLYARLDDGARAASYAAALAGFAHPPREAGEEPAVSREIEPNDNHFTANRILVGVSVEGEISAGTGDVDFFRFRVPPAPRDILAVEVTNLGGQLAPRADIYGADRQVLDWGGNTAGAGRSLVLYGSAAPESAIFVAVSGARGSSGRYLLTIKPMKAYDEYEPNDDIFHARRIPCNVPTEANIMDREDTDFYSFLAPRSGRVSVDLHNDSVTLIPGVQLLGPDLRSMAFGPTVRDPGESLSADLEVEEGRIYYVQVWPQAASSGAYTLIVH